MCFEVLGFDIILDHKLKPYVLEVNHAASFATDSPLDKKIKLEEGDKDFMALTLMHEILHAMNAEINEVQIEYMAQGFCQVIKDNPTLFSRGGVQHAKRKKSKRN